MAREDEAVTLFNERRQLVAALDGKSLADLTQADLKLLLVLLLAAHGWIGQGGVVRLPPAIAGAIQATTQEGSINGDPG